MTFCMPQPAILILDVEHLDLSQARGFCLEHDKGAVLHAPYSMRSLVQKPHMEKGNAS
ncbi:hypothetical protein BDA96_09G051900 [Sorghum bicolor]|uniref:Uncharacterized protein n=1 Tax=Sorghum bicolor TaxID=4558 RepID=A0A921Q7J4_SORBI|nr:hypothetical protein BDA96_09G051900 [Sorghum bicolor]